VVHPFETGIAMVGVSLGDELVDATVNFYDLATGKNVAGSRTYTSASSNPRKFVLTPGAYTVKYVTLGAHKGREGSFEMTVEPGQTLQEVVQLQ
jgi:Ca-activated chloride channel family protein